MKKLVLYSSICAVLLALAAFSFATPLVQPVRTLEIPYDYFGEIVIDGVADAAYSAEQSTEAFNATGSTGADADFTFSFRVAFNPMYLYFIGTILDDFDNGPEYTTIDSIWEYDNVEVFISLDTTGSTNPTTNGYGDDSNCVQLRFNRGLTDSIQTPGRAAQEEYELYFENTASGWLIEAAIPWTVALGEGQIKEDFMDYLESIHGFDVLGNDSDEPGAGHLDCQTAWDMDDPDDPADRTEDSAWTNRSVFGIMTLADASDWIWVGLAERMKNTILVYPNPAGNSINFGIEGLSTICIYSLTGIKLMEVETTGEVDISSLKNGMYLAEYKNSFVKFIKE